MISINYIGNSHNDWLRSLLFYKEEIGILKNRLTEIAGKNTNHELGAQLEHFENQFIVQQDNIDRLKHDIKAHINKLSSQAATNQGHVDVVFKDNFKDLKSKFETEEKLINDLRKEFNHFSSAWM